MDGVGRTSIPSPSLGGDETASRGPRLDAVSPVRLAVDPVGHAAGARPSARPRRRHLPVGARPGHPNRPPSVRRDRRPSDRGRRRLAVRPGRLRCRRSRPGTRVPRAQPRRHPSDPGDRESHRRRPDRPARPCPARVCRAVGGRGRMGRVRPRRIHLHLPAELRVGRAGAGDQGPVSGNDHGLRRIELRRGDGPRNGPQHARDRLGGHRRSRAQLPRAPAKPRVRGRPTGHQRSPVPRRGRSRAEAGTVGAARGPRRGSGPDLRRLLRGPTGSASSSGRRAARSGSPSRAPGVAGGASV